MPRERIIVAQRCLRLRRRASLPDALRDALPVGVCRVEADASRLVIIVKATLEYDVSSDGAAVEAHLAEEQLPLSLARPGRMPGAREDELEYPSDFVPVKAGTDVMLVGHAYRHGPAKPGVTHIDARLSLDEWSRRFFVVAGGAAERLPLSNTYLRSVDGTSPLGPSGPILRTPPPLRPGAPIDARHYNAAPKEQRLLRIPPNVNVGLENLSPRAPKVTVRLPALQPRALVDIRHGGGADVRLRRDTLWIDADAQRIVLVWRGQLRVPNLDRPKIERILISLEDLKQTRSIGEILRQLPRGAFAYAVEPADLEPGATPIPLDDARLRAARQRTWLHPRPPDPVLDLAEYTALATALAAPGAKRSELLAKAGLDEYGMLLEQRAWAGRRAEAVMKRSVS
jgi:hypothetical protein